MVCSSHVKYICKKGDISVVKTEKINKLVTCFCMESFKPSTVRYARRSTQEKRAGDSQTDAEDIDRQRCF